MKPEPIVSVCMITYGHENFIEEAINGVLMQNCNFEIELILANDYSPDKTDEVIQRILNKHPRASIINYIKHEKNIGMMPNFIFAMQQCKGKYIALCEGDDYWTDSLKLQKQVDFLEANPDYVLSFHNAEIINSTTKKQHPFIKEYDKNDYTATDILNSWLIPTASMVFRNVFKGDFPLFLCKAIHGDLALQVYLYEFGKFRAMNDVMSVYRINEGSVTITSFSGTAYNNGVIDQFKLMKVFFKNKYKTIFNQKIFLAYLRKADSYRTKSIIKPLYCIMNAFFLQPSLVLFYKEQTIYSLKKVAFTLFVFLKIRKIDL